MRSLSVAIAALLVAACTFVPTSARAQDSVKVGDQAPGFTLPAATRDSIRWSGVQLSDYIGRNNIVLAFYPADWSGGCTKEVCMMRDNFQALSDLDAQVFGISGDYVYSHYEWAKYHGLQFALLSDHDHTVAKAYQSYNPQSGFNRRTVFAIDRAGKVAYIDHNYIAGSNDSFDALKEGLRRLDK